MLECATITNIWQLAPVLTTWKPEMGTIHQTLLFETKDGKYALRAYRYPNTERWRIEVEHAIIQYVRAQGLPAVAPLPNSTGETIFEQAEHFYAVFPFAPGQQVPRSQLTQREAGAMGSFLGELHRVLHAYPHEKIPPIILTVDLATTLATLNKIEVAIHALPQQDDQEYQALMRLSQQREWLKQAYPSDIHDLAQIEQQALHGDYQEANLFFTDNRVSAIIDWDKAYLAPRALEVIRTLHYCFNLDPTLCRTFLNAYRNILPLAHSDLDTVAAIYSWVQANNLWVYEEFYLQKNERVGRFLKSDSDGPFMPFLDQWTVLQQQVKS